ncbi:MAG: signal peptidase I [Pseudomonadota bacterium]
MASKTKDKEANPIWETVSIVLQALILALILRTFLFQPFNIPSGSMKPTLLVGDYIFVSKYSYGYGGYSLGFGPKLFDGRIWAGEPARGDVVVFRYPPNPTKDYIKRVIGLPGDKVQLQNSTIIINGQPVKREAAGTFTETDLGMTLSAQSFTETLANGVSYTALDISNRPGNLVDNTPVFEVPPGHYFFLGDNRDNSLDSRFDVGFVPADNLIGKAQIKFLSLKDGVPAWQIWQWPTKMRWDRLFSGL